MAGSVFINKDDAVDMISEFVSDLSDDPEIKEAMDKIKEIVLRKMEEDPGISLLSEEHFEEYFEREYTSWNEDPITNPTDLLMTPLLIDDIIRNSGQ